MYLSYLCMLISVCHQRLFISPFPLLLVGNSLNCSYNVTVCHSLCKIKNYTVMWWSMEYDLRVCVCAFLYIIESHLKNIHKICDSETLSNHFHPPPCYCALGQTVLTQKSQKKSIITNHCMTKLTTWGQKGGQCEWRNIWSGRQQPRLLKVKVVWLGRVNEWQEVNSRRWFSSRVVKERRTGGKTRNTHSIHLQSVPFCYHLRFITV